MTRLPKAYQAQIMGTRMLQKVYSEEQMRAYAKKVIANEREACAQLVQDNSMACDPGSVLQVYLASNAAAIRARSET